MNLQEAIKASGIKKKLPLKTEVKPVAPEPTERRKGDIILRKKRR
jgi:hypothetical protein